jgi:hypothetical protein
MLHSVEAATAATATAATAATSATSETTVGTVTVDMWKGSGKRLVYLLYASVYFFIFKASLFTDLKCL